MGYVVPLFLFTVLAGGAAGSYVARAFDANGQVKGKPWLFPLVALVLLAAGGIAVSFHLGHIERVLGAFNNLGAGIAQEGICSIVLGIVIFVDLVYSAKTGKVSRAIAIIGAVAGLLLAAIIAHAYVGFYGIAAWASWATFAHLFFANLALGTATYSLFVESPYQNKLFFGYALAIEALMLVACGAEVAHWASIGADPMIFVVACVLAIVALAVTFLAAREGSSALTVATFALVVAAVIVARCAFFAGYLL